MSYIDDIKNKTITTGKNNSEPINALEALKKIYIEDNATFEDYKIVEKELKEKRKLENAYNSLQEHNEFVLENFDKVCKTLEIIKKYISQYKDYLYETDNDFIFLDSRISQEEYNLLKENLE